MAASTHSLRLVGFLAVLIGYSLLAHFTLQHKAYASFGVLIAMLPLLLMCIVLAYKAKNRLLSFGLLLLLSPLFWLLWSFFKQHYEWIYWLVHESLQVVLLITFAHTLMPKKQPLCAQFAKMVHGSLSPTLASYTRKITIVWSLFFLTVILISSWLFFFYPIKIWSIFSNFIYLPLVALVFIIEYIVRFWALPKKDRSSIMDAIYAFMDKSKNKA